jgi:hypothetical protein
MRIALESTGLPDGSSAAYRIFIQDTVAIARGEVAAGETDTVRLASSEPVTVDWQDALVAISDVEYVFGPAERRTAVDVVDSDTTVAVLGSYSLASGGIVLAISGVPGGATGEWWIWRGDSVLARGPLTQGMTVRRGDIPAGFARLQLDTAYVELDGVPHGYAPPRRDVSLIIEADLDLVAVDAPYALATAVARLRPSGLPAGTVAVCRLTAVTGDHGVIAFTTTGTVNLAPLIRPATYIVSWDPATVDGITYLPDPAGMPPITLEPRIEPYEFAAVYSPEP